MHQHITLKTLSAEATRSKLADSVGTNADHIIAIAGFTAKMATVVQVENETAKVSIGQRRRFVVALLVDCDTANAQHEEYPTEIVSKINESFHDMLEGVFGEREEIESAAPTMENIMEALSDFRTVLHGKGDRHR